MFGWVWAYFPRMIIKYYANVTNRQWRDAHPVLVQCWASVVDAGQHCTNIMWRSRICWDMPIYKMAWQMSKISFHFLKNYIDYSHLNLITRENDHHDQWGFKFIFLCILAPVLLPADTRHRLNAGLMLAQRRRRWASIRTALGRCLVYVG